MLVIINSTLHSHYRYDIFPCAAEICLSVHARRCYYMQIMAWRMDSWKERRMDAFNWKASSPSLFLLPSMGGGGRKLLCVKANHPKMGGGEEKGIFFSCF